MKKSKPISIYISFLLRHKPEQIGLEMDRHGWVFVDALIRGINEKSEYTIDREQLEEIVKNDKKGRYRFDSEHTKIKACQGHSIPWVEPELEYIAPPKYLYHGTTTVAWEKIMQSGEIKKMSRHAVHMQADCSLAWQSAVRWHLIPIVLKINAEKMHAVGYVFGKTENDVWCTEYVPVEFIEAQINNI